VEDKIVQRAVVEVLNAIYELDFLGFSYGFRPKRSRVAAERQSHRHQGDLESRTLEAAVEARHAARAEGADAARRADPSRERGARCCRPGTSVAQARVSKAPTMATREWLCVLS
jgi:hypothetical protein